MKNKTPEEAIIQSKNWRVILDAVLQEMKNQQNGERGNPLGVIQQGGRHLSLSITHLEDAIMRQGMRMKDINEAAPGVATNPYPESYNPDNAKVEPTADGIKM